MGDTVEACCNEAKGLIDDGRYSDAATLLHATLERWPGHFPTRIALGTALSLSGSFPEAESILLGCLGECPDHPDTLFALANAYARHAQPISAEETYKQLLAHHPGHPLAAHNLGALLYEQERFAEACVQYVAAVDEAPENPAGWRDLGQSFVAAGELAAGIATLEKAAERFPDDRLTRFALSLAYLRNQDWEQGWPLYEARWGEGEIPPGPADIPLWQGEALAGRHVLVTGEQGLGDSLMFSRYLPLLANIAGKVSLWVMPQLQRLLRNSFTPSGIDVLAPGQSAPGAAFRIPLGSLPGLLLEHGTIAPPHVLPYLFPANGADEHVVQLLYQWRQQAPERLAVGLVWRGGAGYSADWRRSTSLSRILTGIAEQDYLLVSFQLAPTREEQALMAGHGILDLSPLLTDFHASAAALSRLDLAISVDTAFAHLAGAMAVPVILLHRGEGEWRWGEDRRGSAWYKAIEPVPLPR